MQQSRRRPYVGATRCAGARPAAVAAARLGDEPLCQLAIAHAAAQGAPAHAVFRACGTRARRRSCEGGSMRLCVQRARLFAPPPPLLLLLR
eukprot:2443525-Pleurochrysis_carterae.AAC.1